MHWKKSILVRFRENLGQCFHQKWMTNFKIVFKRALPWGRETSNQWHNSLPHINHLTYENSKGKNCCQSPKRFIRWYQVYIRDIFKFCLLPHLTTLIKKPKAYKLLMISSLSDRGNQSLHHTQIFSALHCLLNVLFAVYFLLCYHQVLLEVSQGLHSCYCKSTLTNQRKQLHNERLVRM